MGIAAALSGDSRLAANYFHQALAVVEPALSARVPELDALYTAADAYSGLGDLKLKDARIPGTECRAPKSQLGRCSVVVSQEP